MTRTLLWLVLTLPLTAQTAGNDIGLRITPAIVAAHACRNSTSTTYTWFATASIQVTDTSTENVIVAREMSAYFVQVSRTKEDLVAGKYLYAPDPHFVSATDTSRRAPSGPNKHFVILHPGESFTTTVKTGVLADTAPGSTLMRDTYVARIGVDTLADWVFTKDQEQKWKRYGRLTQDLVWSEPFELKISFPDNAPKCK